MMVLLEKYLEKFTFKIFFINLHKITYLQLIFTSSSYTF